MSLSRDVLAFVHPEDAPGEAVGCLSGITTGPAVFELPLWMWAATGLSLPVTVSDQQSWPPLTTAPKVPRASLSPVLVLPVASTSFLPFSTAVSALPDEPPLSWATAAPTNAAVAKAMIGTTSTVIRRRDILRP